jgi:type II secretory pathway component GspD/PulD (secretin)
MNRLLKSSAWRALPVLLLSIGVMPGAKAQTAKIAPQDTQTFQLTNVIGEKDTRDFGIALRNLLDRTATVTLAPDQHSFVITATPDQLQLARKVVADLDGVQADSKAQPASNVFVTQNKFTGPRNSDDWAEQTFYLSKTKTQTEANQVLLALRSALDPNTKVYLVATRNAIVAGGTAEQLVQAQKFLSQIDPTWPSTAAQPASDVFTAQGAASASDNLEQQTFYLGAEAQRNDNAEVLITLRNLLNPAIRIYLVTSRNAVLILAPPDQLQLAQKIVNDLDRRAAHS